MQISLPETLPLWPGRPPLPPAPAESPREDWPELTVFRPAPSAANGAAVVICPGGGYWELMIDYEGQAIARWLTAQGFTALVLRYRLAPVYRYPVQLTEVQRAVRVARSRAGEWGLMPHAIGVIGFSAGGHLASMSGTLPALEPTWETDEIDALDHRPNFMMLMYAVINLVGPNANTGSAENLTGEKGRPGPLRKELSTHTRVTAETPPTFLYHCAEDTVVPPQNSLLFYEALLKYKIPAELHIFEKGQHGGGLGADGRHPWTEACARFLKRRVLDAKARQEQDSED